MPLIHIRIHDKTQCGLRATDPFGWNRNPFVKVAEYCGSPEDPLRYEPEPTCPKCLEADPPLRAHLERSRRSGKGGGA